MARILCIDDYPMYAELVASMLRQKGGHEVKSDIVPLDVDSVKKFNPDIIIINLVRRLESISHGGMTNFYHEVEGSKAFHVFATDGMKEYPLIITGLAVSEMDLPGDLRYESFVEIPQKLDKLMIAIDKVVAARKEGSDIIPE